MATTTVKHGQLSQVDEDGNVLVLQPENDGTDVKVDRTANTVGTSGASAIPSDVDNVQKLVNKMGALAFKTNIGTSDFSSGVVTQDLNVTASGKVLDGRVGKTLNDKIVKLEDAPLVAYQEQDDGSVVPPESEINDSLTSAALTWSSKKLSDELTQLNSNQVEYNLNIKKLFSEEQSARKILESRMDTFTSLPNGSTIGNAELQDIRVGYNGTTYSTAGNAVREQISDLNENLDNSFTSYAPIRFNLSDGGLSTDDGSVVTNVTRVRTDMKYIKKEAVITLKKDYQALPFKYSSDGTYIEFISQWYENTFSIPIDGYYRFMIRSKNNSNIISSDVSIHAIYKIGDDVKDCKNKDITFSDFYVNGEASRYIKNVKVYGLEKNEYLALSNIRKNYNGQTGVVLFSCDENGENLTDIASIPTEESYHVIYNISRRGVIEFDVDLTTLLDGGRYSGTGLGFRISPNCYQSHYHLENTSFCDYGIATRLITNVKVYGTDYTMYLSLANIRRNYNGQTGVVLFNCDQRGLQSTQIENIETGIKEHVVREYSWGKISFDIDLTNVADGSKNTGSDLSFRISPYCYFPNYSFESVARYKKPILTIIDDDGKAKFATIANMLKQKGVSATSALITDKVGNEGFMTLDTIMSLKNQGFEFISHSKNHLASIFGTSVNTGNYTNFALIEDADIIDSLKGSRDFLIKYGLNYKALAWPWGHYPKWYNETLNNPDPDGTDSYVCGAENQMARYSRLAKQVGFEYAVNSIGGIVNNTVYDTMWINREPFYSDNENYPLSYYTGLIDNIITNGSWLILMVHCADSTYGDINKLSSVVDYAISHGVSIKTFGDAYAIKRPSITVGEWGSNNGLFIGSDGNKRVRT